MTRALLPGAMLAGAGAPDVALLAVLGFCLLPTTGGGCLLALCSGMSTQPVRTASARKAPGEIGNCFLLGMATS
jgi:high-affinity K+ transport system ATPase subunit B